MAKGEPCKYGQTEPSPAPPPEPLEQSDKPFDFESHRKQYGNPLTWFRTQLLANFIGGKLWNDSQSTPAIGWKWANKTTIVMLLAALPLAAAAQSDDAQVQDVRQIRLQIEILDNVRALNQAINESARYLSLSSDVEQSLRWLQGNEEAGPEQGVGFLFGQIRELSYALGIKSERLSNFMQSVEKPAARVRQVANAANAMIRLARATAEAESSSGADKLNDLADYFGEVKTALSLLSLAMEGFQVNPVIGSYLIIVAKAIEAIADSAEVIQQRTELTNTIIQSERERVLHAEPPPTPADEAKLAEARAGLVAELDKLETEITHRPYREVRAAESECLNEFGLDDVTAMNLRDRVSSARWEVGEKWQELQRLEIGERPSQWADLRDARIRLQTVEEQRQAGAASEAEVERAHSDIQSLVDRYDDLHLGINEITRSLPARIEAFHESRQSLVEFAHCVRRHLADAEYANQGFLADHMPLYASPETFPEIENEEEITARLALSFNEGVRVFNYIPSTPSAQFRSNKASDFHITPPHPWDTTPYHLQQPYSGVISRSPNQKVILAGDKYGYAPLRVDNFLYVQIATSSNTTRFFAGEANMVEFQGVEIPNVQRGFTLRPLDLTSYIPANEQAQVSIYALDFGGTGAVSDVYLVTLGQ